MNKATKQALIARRADLEGKTTAADIAATFGLGISAILFIASSELVLPMLATIGAIAAAAVGIGRIVFEYNKR